MTVVELARLVNAMRAAQKEFMRVKSQGARHEAERLERQVDDVIRQALSQPVLPFGGD